MAKVTIGVPVYNAADYLDAALKSLSEQTCKDMEILVSDNASTDATRDIVALWMEKDGRIRYHLQNENMGALANFDWLIRNAQSHWFMFAAHDDLRSPNYVEALLQAAESHPGVQLAVPEVQLMNENGEVFASYPYHPDMENHSGLLRIFALFRHVRSAWHYALYDRVAQIAAWEKLMAYGHAWGNDFIMLLPFLLSGRIAGANEAVFYQRITKASEARYKPKTLKDQAVLLRDFLRMSLSILWRSPMPVYLKFMLFPRVVYYASERSWRISRLLRHSLKALVLRMVGKGKNVP
ncbi:MAG TPA: hypothetical protein DCW68_06320 [Rhodospirillaceae bacterium]|nr:MAG: hypothetical protein A2018_03900 [Alphaproteobacteria bacterium GWF2_58_20]HAU29705.1 hypothetical protein [Rhodospirillaceae bacterium]